MDVRRTATLKDSNESVGSETRVKVVKNKVAPPFKEAFFDILYGKGIVRENELVTLGVDNEIILKKGSWFSYINQKGEEISLGQGKNSAVEYLTTHPDLGGEIESLVRAKFGLKKFKSESKVEPESDIKDE
jgi:recombination protein RecA